MAEPIDNPPEQPPPAGDSGQGPVSERFQHSPVSARLPEGVAAGAFCTGAIVLEGPGEFIIDFIQSVTRPPRVGARIVMTPRVMSQFVQALRDNLQKYQQAFGPPPALPKPDIKNRPSIRDIYAELKLPDDLLSGAYATTVMIGHSAAEFFFDFITRFFPTAAVSARVYMSAPHVPQVLETFSSSLQNFLRRAQSSGSSPPPASP